MKLLWSEKVAAKCFGGGIAVSEILISKPWLQPGVELLLLFNEVSLKVLLTGFFFPFWDHSVGRQCRNPSGTSQNKKNVSEYSLAVALRDGG